MAKRNIVLRMVATLMTLVFCFGLLPLQTLAANDDQVMDGYFILDENGNPIGNTEEHTNTGHGFTVSKTIEQTGENKFEITLEVQTSQTVVSGDAAIQLVIDRSNSMKWCASCGNQSCRCNAGTRMAAVKAAIAGTDGFLDNLVKNNSGKIYVSVISFGSHAETEIEWTDITSAQGLSQVKNAVNDIRADGGTNLEAGLMLARNRLGMSAIASCGSKYTVLLSDGAPTYYVSGNDNSTERISSNSGNGSDTTTATVEGAIEMATAVKELSALYTICYGVANEELYVSETTLCRHCEEVHAKHIKVETTKYHWLDFLKLFPYTETTYYCPDDSGNEWQQGETVTTEYTVGQFLSNDIASAADKAYAADDTDGINEAFASVCQSAVEGMTGAGTKVTDPMGEFIILGDISNVEGLTATEDGLSWQLDSKTLVDTKVEGNTTTYTYRVKYPITLDTSAPGFQENTYYPANGYTYLSVVTSTGTVQVPFNVPGVQGKLPLIPYTVQYFLQADAEAGDYKNYTEDTASRLTMDPVKAWTTVEAPSGYESKYADVNYVFVAGIISLQVVPEGDNVLKLYYDRIPEPEPTEPEPTEPEPTEPEPTEPEPTEPEPTEPEPTEPEPTEPEPTEPKPTEPEPTEPKPTEPEPEEVEIPEDDVPRAELPKTGDPVSIFAGLTALSGFGITVLARKLKKEEEKTEE